MYYDHRIVSSEHKLCYVDMSKYDTRCDTLHVMHEKMVHAAMFDVSVNINANGLYERHGRIQSSNAKKHIESWDAYHRACTKHNTQYEYLDQIYMVPFFPYGISIGAVQSIFG